MTQSDRPPKLHVWYSTRYLDWRLGPGHPTNPERATLAIQLLEGVVPASERLSRPPIHWAPNHRLVAAAKLVHDSDYVDLVVAGGITEADPGYRTRELGAAALEMFGGTYAMVNYLVASEFKAEVQFNPAGAKHHAMRNRSSGFCALNDMAWAARALSDAGKRVCYLDWDAHHGDGVQELCAGLRLVTTFSVHERGLFPLERERVAGWYPSLGVYNRDLSPGDGDDKLLACVREALATFESRGCDVLLLAAGADGLAEDPLAHLNYTLEGLCKVAQLVGEWAAKRGVPVLVGGAGGYTPHDYTPMAWAGVVATLHREFVKVYARDAS